MMMLGRYAGPAQGAVAVPGKIAVLSRDGIMMEHPGAEIPARHFCAFQPLLRSIQLIQRQASRKQRPTGFLIDTIGIKRSGCTLKSGKIPVPVKPAGAARGLQETGIPFRPVQLHKARDQISSDRPFRIRAFPCLYIPGLSETGLLRPVRHEKFRRALRGLQPVRLFQPCPARGFPRLCQFQDGKAQVAGILHIAFPA